MYKSINHYQIKSARRYKYLLTIARREGAKIIFRIKTQEKVFDIALPSEIEWNEIEPRIKKALGIKNDDCFRIVKYNGSITNYCNREGKIRCFDFLCELQ